MRASSSRELVALLHHRWSVPVLAELHSRAGARFAELVARLDLSRDSLARTLQALIEAGWVRRNPGHGHPLRPEYLPTARGAKIAPACGALWDALRALEVGDVGLNKWSLPALLALCDGEDRFSGLKAALPGVTPRALNEALKNLEKADLVERVVSDARPPAVRYRPTATGRALYPVFRALADALDP